MTSGEATGGCACGAVRYRITPAPSQSLYCHCQLCRHACAAPVTAWVDLAAEHFILLQGQLKEYASSPHARRSFCAQCGTPITYDSTQYGVRDFGVTLHSLDTPNIAPPRLHIWTQSRVINIDDSLPAYVGETPEFSAQLERAAAQQATA